MSPEHVTCISRLPVEVDVLGLGVARHARESPWTFERGTIPVCGKGGRFIGALQEGEQGSLRIGRCADGLVREQKLAERLAEECRCRLRRKIPKAGGRRISI